MDNGLIVRITIPVVAMAALGLVFGVGLAYALKLFGIKVDPMILRLLSALPSANCGACGKAGCSGFAEALVKGEAIPAGCVVSNDEARKSVSEILGLVHESKVKTVATVLCNGGVRAKEKFSYNGLRTCKAASLVFGGQKACSFGCLGFGDCVESCPFDAIVMGPDGLPVIDVSRCTSCGNCVKACPKKLYQVLPLAIAYYVKCSSKDPGGLTSKVCKSGCIGCLKCEKACPNGAAKIESHLSRIDPEKCRNAGKCFEVCPTKVIVKRG